jgi:hypothetical protein
MEEEKRMTNLTAQEIVRREDLLIKFKEERISQEEAIELRNLLEREKQEAAEAGEFVVFLGIVLLLGLVIAFVSGEDKRKKKKKKRLWLF